MMNEITSGIDKLVDIEKQVPEVATSASNWEK